MAFAPPSRWLAWQLLLPLGAALVARTSSAQPAPQAAEVLYREGRAAAAAGNWDVACAKFSASFSAEAAPGTLINLANCEEQRGTLAKALAHFEEATALFPRGDDRIGFAKARANALRGRVPRLVLRTASLPAAAVVRIDNVPLKAEALERPVAVDVGTHTIVVSAPARSDSARTISIAEGQVLEVDLSLGAAAAPPSAPAATSAATSTRLGPPPEKATPQTDAPPRARPQQTAAYILLGAGGVALGVGALGAVRTLQMKGRADEGCATGACSPDGLEAQSQGKTWSTVGTAGVLVGGAALGAGAVLLLTNRSASSAAVVPSPLVTAGGGGLQLTRSF